MKLVSGSLKRRREQLGISQAEVAEGICHQSLLSRIERTDEVSNMTVLQKLCERLQLNAADIARINEKALTPLSVVRRLIEKNQIEEAEEALLNPALTTRIPIYAIPEFNVLRARVALYHSQAAEAMQLLQVALGDVDKYQVELTIEIFTEMGATWTAQDKNELAAECFERACGLIRQSSVDTQAAMASVITHTYRHQAEMYLASGFADKAMERVVEALEMLPTTTDYHEMVALQTIRMKCADALALSTEKKEAQLLAYAAAEFSKDITLKEDVKAYSMLA